MLRCAAGLFLRVAAEECGEPGDEESDFLEEEYTVF